MHQRFLSSTSKVIAILGTFLLLNTVVNAEIYKTVLPDGTVAYSDQPDEDPEGNTEKLEGITVPTLNFPKTEPFKANTPKNNQPAAFKYNDLKIISPAEGTTIRVNSVSTRVAIDPILRPNHMIQMKVNGQNSGNPSSSFVTALNGLIRGEHKVTAVVVDENGATVATSAPLTIYVQLPRAK